MVGSAPARGGRPARGEPVLDRAFRIMAAFGPAHRSLSLTALSARAGLPKATALRLARKLVEWGALERAANGEYVVGLRLLEVASLAPRGHGLRATAAATSRCGRRTSPGPRASCEPSWPRYGSKVPRLCHGSGPNR